MNVRKRQSSRAATNMNAVTLFEPWQNDGPQTYPSIPTSNTSLGLATGNQFCTTAREKALDVYPHGMIERESIISGEGKYLGM
mmetsp:Transcript_23082/g.47698  ORF Transcript_23082/g.47698 Transcript_23082/m.47698 type:complete len:83 (+) Transcript_23082:471-719(+)